MFRHHIITALHTFARFRLNTSINVIGLSFGLACFITAVGIREYILSADRSLPNADRVVMVLQQFTDLAAGVSAPLAAQSSPGLALAIRKEFPELKVAFAAPTTMEVTAEGNSRTINVIVADSEFFSILDLPRRQAVATDPLLAPRSAVVSEEAARRLFGTTNVLGKTIRLRDMFEVTVSAVLQPLPEPSHLNGRYKAFSTDGIVISRATANALKEATSGQPTRDLPLEAQWFVTFSSATYVLLPADGSLSARQLEAHLSGIDVRNGISHDVRNDFRVVPLASAWLASLDLNLFAGNTGISLSTLIAMLGFVILTVACANYANLAFAQTMLHAKEIGLRRAIGASRAQLVQQILLEATLLVAVALALSVAIVFLIGHLTAHLFDIPLLSLLASNATLWASVIVVSQVIVIGISIYPVIALTRIKPAGALRDNAVRSTTGLAARVLFGLQFATTSTLIILFFIVHNQNSIVKSQALDTNADVIVSLSYEAQLDTKNVDVWREELTRYPAIIGVSSTNPPPWRPSFAGLLTLQPITGGFLNPNQSNVNYDFEKVLDMHIVAGRSFSRAFEDVQSFPKGARNIVIDTTLATRLGFSNPADAVGKIMSMGGRFESEPPVTIIGVVADRSYRLQPFLNFVGTAYVPSDGPYMTNVVRIERAHLAEGLQAIEKVSKSLMPSTPVSIEFSDDAFARSYAIYRAIGTLLTTIAFAALGIAALGAFSFALFIVDRRSHEIGVRKTLGATVTQVLTLLLSDFSKPILFACIAGWPIAFIAAQRYLSNFEVRTTLTPWPFVIGLGVTIVIAWVAIGGHALRAARLMPADVLRHE